MRNNGAAGVSRKADGRDNFNSPARNVLSREGIKPSQSRLIQGSKFGQGSPNPSRARDQHRQALFPQANPNYIAGIKNAATMRSLSNLLQNPQFLLSSRSEWISLGDGWHQATCEGSGCTNKSGMHSIIDNSNPSMPGAPFVCIYEPRTKECYDTCTSAEPFFDLECSAKVIRSNDPLRLGASRAGESQLRPQFLKNGSLSQSSAIVNHFQVLFCFQSFSNYLSLTCDLASHTWTCMHSLNGTDIILGQVIDMDIKANVFFQLLVQVRGTYCSIDINNNPVFTSVRTPDGMPSLYGLPGLAARSGTKFAIKGWKLRNVLKQDNNSNFGGGMTQKTASPQSLELNAEPEYEQSLLELAANYEYSSERDDAALYIQQEEVQQREYLEPELEFEDEGPEEWNYPKSSNLGTDSSLGKYLSKPINSSEMDDGYRNTSPNSSGKNAISLAEMMKIRIEGKLDSGESTSNGAAGTRSLSSLMQQKRAQREQGESPKQQINTIFNNSATAAASVVRKSGGSNFNRREMLENKNSSGSLSSSYTGSTNNVCKVDANDFGSSNPTTTTNQDIPVGGKDFCTLAEAAQALSHSHDRSVIDTVLRDVVQTDLSVSFDDIAELGQAKRLLSEAVILPLLVPEFFIGIREPWKGVLLFGPPGTGKTLLAKAVCSLNQSRFFNCPSSSLVSKYRGESEKIIRCLFEAARLLAPTVVFLDEVDALVGSRGGQGEHEASRRLKTEIFSQMDGIASSSQAGEAGYSKVMVLATTNCPWDLDEAIRRRLEKRIYIPLPNLESRAELFRISLRDMTLADDVDLMELAHRAEGYSGADVRIVCREACMMPMRKILECARPEDIRQMHTDGQLDVCPVNRDDFYSALENTKPSVADSACKKFQDWENEFGSA